MIKNIRLLLFAILLLGAASRGTFAQETVVPQLAEPLLALPASDMLVTVDMRRIMDEAVPRLLTNAPQARARLKAELDKIRTKIGFDFRSIDRVVIGIGDFNLSSGGNASAQPGANDRKMPGRFVAIATGSFNAPVLVAAARLASGGKYREENYAQSTLYTFTLDKSATPEAFSAISAPEISVASVDAHTIIVGLPASVRATIDLRSGAGGQSAANAELISLANSVSRALIGVGADVKSFTKQPLAIVKSPQKLELTAMDAVGSKEEPDPSSGTENEITKALEAVRQVFFSIGMADRAFNVHVVARTEQSAQAQDLANMLEALRGFADSAKDPKVRKMLDAVKVISQNNELQVTGDFAQTDIASLITDKDLKFNSAGSSRNTLRSGRRAGGNSRARRRR